MQLKNIFYTAKKTASVFTIVSFLAACSGSGDGAFFAEVPPPIPLQDVYLLSSEDSIPEGVGFDPVDRAFYVGGFNGAGLTRIDANGEETVFREVDDRAELTGIKIDAEARRLWVCARNVDDIDARVWVFDLNSGNLTIEFLLGALFTNASCNDLVLDQDGIAYVTDSSNPNIYRLDPQSEVGSIFVSDPLLADPFGIGLGSNGIVFTENQDNVIVGKFLEGQLIRIPLENVDELSMINLQGDALVQPDGLALMGNDVYAVSDQTVTRIRLDADFANGAVSVRQQPESGLTTGVFAQGELYVVKSEVRNFIQMLPLDLPLQVFRVDLAVFE